MFVSNKLYQFGDVQISPINFIIFSPFLQTLSGAGFHPSIEDELKHMKERVKAIKKRNAQINHLSVSLPSLGLKELKQREKHNEHTHIYTNKPKNKHLKPLTLADKLNQAVKEATAESKLYEMERKIKAKNSTEPIFSYNFQDTLASVSKPTTAVDPKLLKQQASFSDFAELNNMLSVSMEKTEMKNKEEIAAKIGEY